jgi:hypothetical protein
MTPKEMKNTVVTADGIILPEDRLRNPLEFRLIPSPYHACGQIAAREIASSGKQMILYFDIDEHNTYYEIDSLPFQEGVFHLRSLRCKDGADPPLIDNRRVGKCLVSAENWEGSDEEWVRYIVPSRPSYGGGYIWKSADFCRGKPLDVMTSRDALAAAWNSYREATNGNSVPDVDFRREVVLIPYMPARSAAYSIKSLKVDKSGDLTFDPGPEGSSDPKNCSILFLIINRAGIKSVGGKPLPPVSNQ